MDESLALEAFFTETLGFLEREAPQHAAALRQAVGRWRERHWSVLVSGLCSVGKSSFVCALWGDPELLPTAVRDCTQTNTRVRVPTADEADRQVRLSFLTRAEAAAFVTQ